MTDSITEDGYTRKVIPEETWSPKYNAIAYLKIAAEKRNRMFEVGDTIQRTKKLKTEDANFKKGDQGKVFHTGYPDGTIGVAIPSATGNENILYRVTEEGWKKVN